MSSCDGGCSQSKLVGFDRWLGQNVNAMECMTLSSPCAANRVDPGQKPSRIAALGQSSRTSTSLATGQIATRYVFVFPTNHL